VLYDVVGTGMRAYAGTRFDVRTFGAERVRLDPGTIVVSTHRSDHDVPLICGTIYFATSMWRRRDVRLAFAVRDDLFEPGFFGGYPYGLPLRLRRLLWPLSVGGSLERRLACIPIRSATTMRLVQLLRMAPALALDRLPGDVAPAAERRAHELGLRRPEHGGSLLRPEYGDLLWRLVARREVDAPELDELWRRRAAAALEDFRRLVGVVRGGGRLLLFPEGRPSPDGEIGPLLPGLSALVRRSAAAFVQPVGLAYDPLAGRRTRAYVSYAEPFAVPQEGVAEERVLETLRAATPLTVGQLAAEAALDGGRVPDAVAAAAVAQARASGRPVDPELLAAPRESLERAVAAARRAPAETTRLAREARSARGS
jgi:1-acyl-sn-glycerol-3-phosphate acyltransferase